MTLSLAGCSEWFPSRYRFRLTVEVDTPQGLRLGSSVMEVASAATTIKLPESAGLATYLRGEAVAVDLPGGTMFALVSETASGQTLAAEATLALEPIERGVPESFLAAVQKLSRRDQRGKMSILPPSGYPKLVRFRNPADRNSIEVVDPLNLASSFDHGVSLRRITVTVTNEPLKTGIEKRLPKPNSRGIFNSDENSAKMGEETLGIWDFREGFGS
jgi:hypothetical protein